jgi:hypothetical protein
MPVHQHMRRDATVILIWFGDLNREKGVTLVLTDFIKKTR